MPNVLGSVQQKKRGVKISPIVPSNRQAVFPFKLAIIVALNGVVAIGTP
jgi:hypothetical protein